MSLYDICAKGCDEENIVQLDLTDAEVALIERLAAALKAGSRYDCMPRLGIRPAGIDREWSEDFE